MCAKFTKRFVGGRLEFVAVHAHSHIFGAVSQALWELQFEVGTFPAKDVSAG